MRLLLLVLLIWVGDRVTLDNPYITGDELVVFHISDAILSLEELQYEGTIDFENGERYDKMVLSLGIHAVQGSDKPYAGHPNLFRQRYARLLGTALEMSDEVAVINIPWLNWTDENAERAIKWNSIIAEEAALRGVCVVDAWSVMYKCGMACISDDGYHPNATGYTLIAREIAHCASVDIYLPLIMK